MSSANNPPDSEEILYRAVMRANRATFTIDMQIRRIESTDPEDALFLFRRIADFEFLVVATSRLRRAAKVAKNASETKSDVTRALAQFDRSLPGLKKLRDIAEHIDEYSVDDGRDRHIYRRHLDNFMVTNGGRTYNWLGESINLDDLLNASAELFQELKRAQKRIEQLPSNCVNRSGESGGI